MTTELHFTCRVCDEQQQVPAVPSLIVLTPSGLVIDCANCGPVWRELLDNGMRDHLYRAGAGLLGEDGIEELRCPDGRLRMPLDLGEIEALSELIASTSDLVGLMVGGERA